MHFKRHGKIIAAAEVGGLVRKHYGNREFYLLPCIIGNSHLSGSLAQPDKTECSFITGDGLYGKNAPVAADHFIASVAGHDIDCQLVVHTHLRIDGRDFKGVRVDSDIHHGGLAFPVHECDGSVAASQCRDGIIRPERVCILNAHHCPVSHFNGKFVIAGKIAHADFKLPAVSRLHGKFRLAQFQVKETDIH